MCSGMTKSFSFFPLGDTLREMQLLERAVLGIRCSGEKHTAPWPRGF